MLHENKGILVECEKAHFVCSETIAWNPDGYEARLTNDHLETNIKMLFQVATLPTTTQGNGESTIVWRVHHAITDAFLSGLVIT